MDDMSKNFNTNLVSITVRKMPVSKVGYHYIKTECLLECDSTHSGVYYVP
jgi:hypothetical protein